MTQPSPPPPPIGAAHGATTASGPSPVEPAASDSPAAARTGRGAIWEDDAQGSLLRLWGDARGGLRLPAAPALPLGESLRIDGADLTHYDSLLAAELWDLSRRTQRTLDTRRLPEGLQRMLGLAAQTGPLTEPPTAADWLTRVGLRSFLGMARAKTTLTFVGQVLIALGRALRGRTAMRAEDVWQQLHATGPSSLPIVSLVSFLVGLIIAYMGAAQLQRFGAQIYMADLVTIGVVREIAALMTGIILAGRVGAAFAAQLGSMQANEEVDALESLGLQPVENLILPRVLAMALMAPLLTTYAALVGMAAGLLVAVGIYHVEPTEYLVRSLRALTLTHIGVGLLKGTVYAILVALAGCRQGLNAGRSAQAVGDATTSAVVQSIVWMVVAASLLTIAFQRLGW